MDEISYTATVNQVEHIPRSSQSRGTNWSNTRSIQLHLLHAPKSVNSREEICTTLSLVRINSGTRRMKSPDLLVPTLIGMSVIATPTLLYGLEE